MKPEIFFEEQIRLWPLAQTNYQLLSSSVRIKEISLANSQIKVQYNPTRIVSSGAKVDTSSIRERPCFLCEKNRPAEQISLPIDDKFSLLCNPYPIFPEHFTIVSGEHELQQIRPYFSNLLAITCQLPAYTVFYNGPQSGASAPDHLHLQACTHGYMPIDNEWRGLLQKQNQPIVTAEDAALYAFNGYLRNGFIIKATRPEEASRLFNLLYSGLQSSPLIKGETEPMMNIIAYYQEGGWIIVIIPRKKHRPRQYFAEGEEHFLSSPGAADIGGVFITTSEKDYEKTTAELLCEIYNQVCLNDDEICLLAEHIKSKS
ncbi:hypothetical protein M2459_002888 [Parabacteroides sp. PF5-5]|uniref:DUF4922 domain-containing protein n=1 Tax=unclassified Parabacteroides TaxID=2649774 RepID=UPI0024769AF7|nr:MULTISPECIES: DUF4922 domain-containing protein [unclassified Parabacteroides]MDH6306174.1 hypothetical protein [Parabacteroides sp. PH5-39]MDH6317133.1 hypothetical protein [Parabacteroides sp. PF5-13]MDH6320886.1 hypothetical protein [Parabacteroides sp. PH5-13]MDH6324617.1 hypothetical protein [Parabacteroides sp. PH5-8]MDH6328332.1 hypothetical protein [Parabacteroides sp. PH5-41]